MYTHLPFMSTYHITQFYVFYYGLRFNYLVSRIYEESNQLNSNQSNNYGQYYNKSNYNRFMLF